MAAAGAGTAGAAVTWPLLAKIALYFAEAGSFVFGSGLAIVPFLHGGVVNQCHWITEQQFLDAVAVAMITPGPVVITMAFVGYLVAGPLGATAASVGVFLPCYLFVIIPAPYFRRFADNPKVRAFVDGSRRGDRSDRRRRLRAGSTRPHRPHDRGNRRGDLAGLHALQENP